MAAVVFKRHIGYVCGNLLAVLGLALYIFGMSCPYWIKCPHQSNSDATKTREYRPSANSGLWNVCESPSLKFCHQDNIMSGWYTWVRVLQCIGLVGYFVALGYAAVVNCRRTHPVDTRFVEITLLLSGVPALIGALLYMYRVQSYTHKPSTIGRQSSHGDDCRMSWAFFLDINGIALLTMSAVVVANFNRPFPASGTGIDVCSHSEHVCEAASGRSSVIIGTEISNIPPPYYVLFPERMGGGGTVTFLSIPEG